MEKHEHGRIKWQNDSYIKRKREMITVIFSPDGRPNPAAILGNMGHLSNSNSQDSNKEKRKNELINLSGKNIPFLQLPVFLIQGTLNHLHGLLQATLNI